MCFFAEGNDWIRNFNAIELKSSKIFIFEPLFNTSIVEQIHFFSLSKWPMNHAVLVSDVDEWCISIGSYRPYDRIGLAIDWQFLNYFVHPTFCFHSLRIMNCK